MQSLLASLGGAIVGTLPGFNGYVAEFSGVKTLRELDDVRRQLRANPLVQRASHNVKRQLLQGPMLFDLRDSGAVFPGTDISIAVAYTQARIWDAIEAIRRTPPYDETLTPGQLGDFNPVKIAVVDTGFRVHEDLAHEFIDPFGQNAVEFISAFPAQSGISGTLPVITNPADYVDTDGHGTTVTSIIAAINNGEAGMTGALNGLFRPGEMPYTVSSYRVSDDIDARSMDTSAIFAALEDIRRRGDVNIVNLSFGSPFGPLSAALADQAEFKPYFEALGDALIVVAAGNIGIDVSHFTPASLAATLENVMAIGATSVVFNTDLLSSAVWRDLHYRRVRRWPRLRVHGSIGPERGCVRGVLRGLGVRPWRDDGGAWNRGVRR